MKGESRPGLPPAMNAIPARRCLSVGAGRVGVVGQAIPAGPCFPGRGVVVSAVVGPVVLRVGMDGAVSRVPFVTDERGAGRLFREQIGCSLFDVIRLDDGLDMWVDDEAIVGVDLGDRKALADALNIVATMIANRLGRPGPVFGTAVITKLSGESAAGLDPEQIARVEALAEMSAAVFSDVLAKRSGTEREGARR